MKCKQVLFTGLASLLLFSCVSSKKYKGEIAKYEQLNGNYIKLQGDLKGCEDAKAEYDKLLNAGLNIYYHLKDEIWGQRRFGVTDPNRMYIDIVQQTEPQNNYWDQYLPK